MNTPQKIAGFGVGLAVVFAAAVGLGATLGPDGGAITAEHLRSPEAASVEPGQHPATAERPSGLSSTDNGYTLELAQTRVNAGKQVALRFWITDATGVAVTRFVDNHEKQLHLIVVRRDMVGFQHVHPTIDGTGTWSRGLPGVRGLRSRGRAAAHPRGGPTRRRAL